MLFAIACTQNGTVGDQKPTDFERRINEAVFPGLQGGPHENTIAAIAVALREAASPNFRAYQKQVLSNMQHLCTTLNSLGYEIVTGGSETHVCLLDLRPNKLDGSRVERVLELVGICDKCFPEPVLVTRSKTDESRSSLSPSGIRLGTAALTSRGLLEADITKVAGFIHQAVLLTLRVNELAGSKLIKDFHAVLNDNQEIKAALSAMKNEVEAFAAGFPMPGFPNF
ncbi:unnamed protein product [Echinostoma caproni]|uniref:Glycine hydroxymethyltransferase n=1 Tax=Echinostoma caproni TaxID=27848 RepID=A0A183AT33_9TREM|nr:unnamed protein product [Echinostoma caproni]